jgi:hypothetical protein
LKALHKNTLPIGHPLVSTLQSAAPYLNIITTGCEEETSKPDSSIHDVADWLVKPFFMNDLVAALDRVA